MLENVENKEGSENEVEWNALIFTLDAWLRMENREVSENEVRWKGFDFRLVVLGRGQKWVENNFLPTLILWKGRQ